MPYSKNPDKYPEEMLALLTALEQYPQGEVRLACATPQEAHGRKIQIQSYFSAVERRAKEMEALATRAAGKQTEGEALSIAHTWLNRSWTAAKWCVRSETAPPAVVLQRRGTTGAFGEALSQFLQQAETQPAHQTAQAPESLGVQSGDAAALAADPYADQMALLRQATEQMLARQSGGKN